MGFIGVWTETAQTPPQNKSSQEVVFTSAKTKTPETGNSPKSVTDFLL